MTYGTARREEGFGYYNIGGLVFYFNKKPTKEDIQNALEKAGAEAETLPFSHINCGGACCADQPKIIN